MIERAAECLENGGRCFLRVPKIPFRSRRSLHSTFWSHGAGNINLPSWWIALLQTPQTETHVCSPQGITDRIKEGVFMDFLYPVQTVAFLHQLISRDITSLLSHRRKRNTHLCSRAYTSNASDSTSISRSNPLKGNAEPAVATVAGEDQVREEFNKPLGGNASAGNREKLWRAYQNIQDLSLRLAPAELIRLLRCLSTSENKIDIERSLLLFARIPVHERRAIHYSHAVTAALSQNDLEMALGFHCEALSRIQRSIGTSAILRYTVQQALWQPAIETWGSYWSHKEMYFERPDIWTGVDAIPLHELMDKALSAAEFAIHAAETASENAAVASRGFALQLILRSFNIRGTVFDLGRHKELFGKAKALEMPRLEMYGAAIFQLLSIDSLDHGRAAIQLYREMRNTEAVIPSLGIMRAVLFRLGAIRSPTGVFMMLEDYRKYHGGPTAWALKFIIHQLARQGNSEAVFELFQEFRTRFGKPQSPKMYHSLIFVYFQRGQVEKAIQVFQSLEDEYGFAPDLESWNLVIASFARVGDYDGALTWFNKLTKTNLKPNSRTYTNMMAMYAKRGDLEAVAGLYQQAKSDNVKVQVAMIDHLVLAHTNNDQLAEAWKLAEDALHMDLEGPRTRMWNILITACAMRKDVGKVSEIHRRMQEAGVPFDSMTYAALMQSLVIIKQPDAAKKILKVVMPRSKIRTSPFHYAIVMGGYLAVKNYSMVFDLYSHMLKRNIKPVPSVQNAVLRAAASVDMQKANSEGTAGTQLEMSRAQEVLDQTLADMDPMELAGNGPVKFFGVDRLDEAFSSSYFSYLVFLYGRENAFAKVSELYDRYIATAQSFRQDVEISPPMKMLSALMVAHHNANDHEEVERCWYLALDKAEKLARRSKASDLSEPGWVLPSRRFILNTLLPHYFKSLEAQHRVNDIIATIDDLHTSGYALTSNSWNLYIQALVRNNHELLAYVMCERELIHGWPGWETFGGTWTIRSRFRAMTPSRLQTNRRMPNYRTLVYLAAAYMDAESANSNLLEQLSTVAPKTLQVIRTMPKIEDELQGRLLRRY